MFTIKKLKEFLPNYLYLSDCNKIRTDNQKFKNEHSTI